MQNIENEIFQFIIGNQEKIEFLYYKKNPSKLQQDSLKSLCHAVLKYMIQNEEQTSECLNYFSSLSMNQILTEASDNFNQDFNQRIEHLFLLSKLQFCRQMQRECIFQILKQQKISFQYDIFEDMLKNQSDLTYDNFKKLLLTLVAFFQTDPRGYHEIWDTSKFFDLIIENNQSDEVRPFFNNLTIQIMEFNDAQKKEFLRSLYQNQEQLFSDNQEVQQYLQSLSYQECKMVTQISDFQKKKVKQSIFQQQQQYVETINSQNAIQLLQSAILTNNFVILDGPISSGKSTIIQQAFQKVNIIRVYLDNTTDLKSLIGSYVCSEKIGHFEWKSGPLAQTMMNGSILILENFQESNQEVINGLISVIEQGCIDNMQGGILQQKTGFKIIGVSNFELQKDFEFQSKKQLLLKAAEFIQIPAIQMDEIQQIIMSKFPNISLVFDKIKEILSKLLQQGHKYKNLMINNPKRIIALCNRINIHQNRIYGSEGILNNLLTFEFRKIILLEIIDCFLLQEKNLIHDTWISDVILKSLDLQQEELNFYLTQYCPTFETSSLQISFERIGLLQRDHFGKSGGDQSKDDIFQIIYNSYSSRLLEKIASCLYFNDPCLLIGDTGCGKTTLTQHFAKLFQKKLHVYNMNQGSDAVDLIGGFKPIEIKILIKNVLIKYVQMFETVANMKSNQKYLSSLSQFYESSSFNSLLKCMLDSLPQIKEKIKEKEHHESFDYKKNFKRFNKIEKQIQNIYANRDKIESNLAFHFVEGNLINAMKQGDWILIDEINLANNEVLQRILPIIEGESLILYDRGDIKQIKRHKDFRVIGCMNPGSDIGKKELPLNIKSKFIQIFVHEIEQRQDIQMLVSQKVGKLVGQTKVDQIVELFIQMRQATDQHLMEESNNKKPHISLRNMARSLSYIRANHLLYGVDRATYDGLYLGFGSALSPGSRLIFEEKLKQIIGFSAVEYQKMLKQVPTIKTELMRLFGFYLESGPQKPKTLEECEFLVTQTFEKHIVDLLRAISNCDLPVLIEGPTSSGKTSVIKFLAELTGHKCVRINNHHHTDVEEYIGTYLPDQKGRLVFIEGILIEAMKAGHWLILDELNLARSEILESLNRLLDDNKELFVNEQQIYIKPHKNFRIFATQNPTSYGGRKELSKAFKNRFIQLYFGDIGESDLMEILQKRCQLPVSFCKRLMSITKDLRLFRQKSNFFMGKEGVITVRDLIKWGKRNITTKEDLAIEGYCLLAERLRSHEEREEIKKIIEKHCSTKLEPSSYYKQFSCKELNPAIEQSNTYLQMNGSFQRMAALTMKALENNEPVLLIGETGCGKTTLCELIAYIRKSKLFTINCHQNTESSDFLGSLRPLRNREEITKNLQQKSNELLQNEQEAFQLVQQYIQGSIIADKIIKELKKNHKKNQNIDEIIKIINKNESLFEWQDGPLVQAMDYGGVFLIDEISLAEDSVLERLNSVLETERTLLLPEKGGKQADKIKANDGFIIVATMNPGGDFGKRELSPALRNRFTEIWVEAITSKQYLKEESQDVIQMVEEYLSRTNITDWVNVGTIATKIYQFLRYFNVEFCEKYSLEKRVITMRDITALREFFIKTKGRLFSQVYQDGLEMIALEPLGFLGLNQLELSNLQSQVSKFLYSQIDDQFCQSLEQTQQCKIDDPFYDQIQKGDQYFKVSSLIVQENLKKLRRALYLDKAILLEGGPGVGKSSLIEYLSRIQNKKLFKVTLSEQTDIVDLLGSDLPNDEGKIGFRWYDGVLLEALKKGHWVLLDELNLASQSVLEGLNAILDHRGTVFIPETNSSFQKHPEFRVFGTQNPMRLGGGRRGLPSSFLNRFSKIYCKDYEKNDFQIILQELQFPNIAVIFDKIYDFAQKTGVQYNLRDFLRFFDIYNRLSLREAIQIIFIYKQKSYQKRVEILNLAQKEFGHIFQQDKEIRKQTGLYQGTNRKGLLQLNSQQEFLHVLKYINASTLITGISGCGKSAMVQLLAKLTNNEIVHIQLSPSTDSSELIGSYDQVNDEKADQILLDELSQALDAHLQYLLGQDVRKLWAIFKIRKTMQRDSFTNKNKILNYIKQIQTFQISNEKDGIITEEQTEFYNIIEKIKQKIQQQKNITTQTGFRWFFAPLIKALKKGQWLVLDNVHLANPAILARLNPLLEGQSQMIITECFDKDQGGPLMVDVHPNFRVFMIGSGDGISIPESIRNRCVEICVEQILKDISLYKADLELVCYAQNISDYKQKVKFCSQVCQALIQTKQEIPLEFNLVQKNQGQNLENLRQKYNFQMIYDDSNEDTNKMSELFKKFTSCFQDQIDQIQKEFYQIQYALLETQQEYFRAKRFQLLLEKFLSLSLNNQNRLLFKIYSQDSIDSFQFLVKDVINELDQKMEDLVITNKIQLHEFHPFTLTQKLIHTKFMNIQNVKELRKILCILNMLDKNMSEIPRLYLFLQKLVNNQTSQTFLQCSDLAKYLPKSYEEFQLQQLIRYFVQEDDQSIDQGMYLQARIKLRKLCLISQTFKNNSLFLLSKLFYSNIQQKKSILETFIKEVDKKYKESEEQFSQFQIQIFDEYNEDIVLKQVPIINSDESVEYWCFQDLNQFSYFWNYIKYLQSYSQTQSIGYIDQKQLLLQQNSQNCDTSIELLYLNEFQQMNSKYHIQTYENILEQLKIKDIKMFLKIQQEFQKKVDNNLEHPVYVEHIEQLVYTWVVEQFSKQTQLFQMNPNYEQFDSFVESIQDTKDLPKNLDILIQNFSQIRSSIDEDEKYLLLGQTLIQIMRFTSDDILSVLEQNHIYLLKKSKIDVDINTQNLKWLNEKLINNYIDFTSADSQSFQNKLQKQNDKLNKIHEKIVYRGDLIDAFQRFTSTQLDKVLQQVLEIRKGQQIEYQNIIQNAIQQGHDRFYSLFKDLMIPINLGLLFINKSINLQNEKIHKQKQTLVQKLIQVDDFNDMLTLAEQLISNPQFHSLLHQQLNFFKSKCFRKSFQALTPEEEEIDMDEDGPLQKFDLSKEAGTKHIKTIKALQETIVDEYTKKAVIDNRYYIKLQKHIQNLNEMIQIFYKQCHTAQQLIQKNNYHLFNSKIFSRQKIKDEIDEMFNKYDEDLQIVKNLDSKTLKEQLESLDANKDIVKKIESEKQQKATIQKLILTLIKQKITPLRFNVCQIQSQNLLEIAYQLENYQNLLNEKISLQKDVHQPGWDDQYVIVQDLFNKVLLRINYLLQQTEFQNNAVLQGLAVLIDHILDGKCQSTPLIRLIQGVQMIIEKIFDWNQIVPRAFEIDSLEMQKLLSCWRKGERMAWKQLLYQKDNEIELEDIEMLMKFSDMIQNVDQSKNKDEEKQTMQQVFKLTDEFLRNSKLGQLQLRMKFLQFFQDNKRFFSIFRQLISYFNLYDDVFAEKMKSIKNESETDIKECVTLVGWDSNNFHTLKSTVEKFHKRLYKIVKSYKDHLNAPAQLSIITVYQQRLLFDSMSSIESGLRNFFNEQKLLNPPSQSSYNGEDQILQISQKLLSRNKQFKTWIEIENIIEIMFERMQSLQIENIKKQQKFRAVQDFYKLLKQLGLSSLYKIS